MTTPTPDEPVLLDQCLSRLVDRRAQPADWEQIQSAASSRPELWREVAEMLHLESELGRALDPEVERSAAVELPLAHQAHPRRVRLAPRVAWKSLAAAAALVMTFFIGRGTQPDVTPPTTATPTGTDVLMSRYLQKGVEEGLVLGELPRQVLQLRPAGDGQAAELITVRRIVERRMATEFYRLDHDEYGQARQVPIELASLRSESSF